MKYESKDLGSSDDASRGKHGLGFQLMQIASGVLGIYLLYVILVQVGGAASGLIPDSLEAQMTGFKKGEAKSVVEGCDRAEKIFQTLINAVPSPRSLPYGIRCEKDSGLGANAVALPGGQIIVTTDLLVLVESEIGLATVIAHEIGHHEHRHLLKRMSGSALGGLVFSQDSEISRFTNLMALKFSRDDEREADQFAADLVYKVYGSLDGSSEFFRKIDAEQNSSFLSTHPGGDERVTFFENWGRP